MDDRERLASVVASAGAYWLHRDGVHAVVTLDAAGKPWSPGTVYERRSSAQAQATRYADTLDVLAYVVSRHDGNLTVWAGPETVLLTIPLAAAQNHEERDDG